MKAPSRAEGSGCGRDSGQGRGALLHRLGRATHPNMRRSVNFRDPVAAGGVEGVNRTGEPVWVAVIRQDGRLSRTPADLRLRIRRPRAWGRSEEGDCVARSRWEPGTFRRGGAVAARLGRFPVDGRCNSFTRPISPAGPAATPAGPARGGRCVSAGRHTPFVSGPLGVARENLALTNRRQPGSDAVRKGPKSDPVISFTHAQQHEEVTWKTPGRRTLEIFGGVA